MNATAFERWMALGKANVVVSICFGELGEHGPAWSVLAMRSKTVECFDRPFHATSFDHCVEIAETEAKKRGWIA